jgi:hypothetical protein
VKSRRDAILEGAKAAARIHRQFDTRRIVEAQPSSIDVLGTIVKQKIPSYSSRSMVCGGITAPPGSRNYRHDETPVERTAFHRGS